MLKLTHLKSEKKESTHFLKDDFLNEIRRISKLRWIFWILTGSETFILYPTQKLVQTKLET